jgi:hypothetical protein
MLFVRLALSLFDLKAACASREGDGGSCTVVVVCLHGWASVWLTVLFDIVLCLVLHCYAVEATLSHRLVYDLYPSACGPLGM